MVTEKDLGYLAGIIDGEGSIIVWTKSYDNTSGYHIGRVVISNNDKGILNECKRILTDLGIFYSFCGPSKFCKTSEVYQISVDRQAEVTELIKLLKLYFHSEQKLLKCVELENFLKERENYRRIDGKRSNARKKYIPEEKSDAFVQF